MQLALDKYEKNLFQAKIESDKDLTNLNKIVEIGKLESITALRARTLKKDHLKRVLEAQVKESELRRDEEREMIRSRVCTGYKS